MKKIFIVIGSLDLGGTEKQLLLKLLSLKNKFNFSIVVFYKRGDLYNIFKDNGIKIFDVSNNNKFIVIKIIRLLINLILLIKKERPSIINLYLPHSYLLAGWLSIFFRKIKFLMTRRSLNNYQRKLPFVKFIETQILHKYMKNILVNSRAIFEQMIEEENVKKEKLKLIYNSVKIKKCYKKYKNKKIVQIIFLANLIHYKNNKLVIESCRSIKEKNFQVNFVGEGNPHYVNELKSLTLSYNLKDKIKFLGKIRDLDKIMNESDIGILASDEEGFSNAILEYMSYKLPVIATDVGGNSEAINHGYTGYIVRKGDYKNFSKYLTKLILDVNLRKRLGLAGYQIVKQKFEVSKNIISYHDFYKNLISND